MTITSAIYPHQQVSTPTYTGSHLAPWIAESLLMPGRPQRVARMNGPNTHAKYQDIRGDLTQAMLAQHATGRATYAATLHQDGMARAGCIDIDDGGRAAVLRTLAAAAHLQITAFALVIETEQHAGGHVWCLYAEPVPAAAIAAQLQQVTALADLPTAEIWPRNQNIRLPFGWHTRATTYGTLYTQAGTVFDLDDSVQHAAGVATVIGLAANPAPPPPETKPPPIPTRAVITPRPVAPGARVTDRMNAADVRQHFNATHDLEQLITADGAVRTRDGFTCPCGVAHTHATTLFISTQGKLFSYSPRCTYYTTKGWDAFGYYVLTRHNNNVVDALKALNPYTSHVKRPVDEAPNDIFSPEAQARRAAENAQRCQQRQDANRATLNDLEAIVSAMDLPARAHVLAAYLFDLANAAGSLQVRPTNKQIAHALGYSERSIQYAFKDLHAARIGVRRGGTGGLDRPNEAATWTFNRARARVQNTPETGPESTHYGEHCTLGIQACDLDPDPEEHVSAPPEAPQPAIAPVESHAAPAEGWSGPHPFGPTFYCWHEATNRYAYGATQAAAIAATWAGPAPAVDAAPQTVEGPPETCSAAPATDLLEVCAWCGDRHDPAHACYNPAADRTAQAGPPPVRVWTKSLSPSQYVDAHRRPYDEYWTRLVPDDALDAVPPDAGPHQGAAASSPAPLPPVTRVSWMTGMVRATWRTEYRATLEAMAAGKLNGERMKQQRSVAKAEREGLSWLKKARDRLAMVYAEMQRRRATQPPTPTKRRAAPAAAAPPAVVQPDLFASSGAAEGGALTSLLAGAGGGRA